MYYGTEQALTGTVDAAGNPVLDAPESVREALWGKVHAFDETGAVYKAIKGLASLRNNDTALRYGRLYFREVSGNGRDFGQSSGAGGLLAFSRVLADREVVVIANTSSSAPFDAEVLLDLDLSRSQRSMSIVYSNHAAGGSNPVTLKQANVFRPDGTSITAQIASVAIHLSPNEIQVLAPA